MPRVLLLMTSTTYRAEAFVTAAARTGLDLVVGTDRPQVLAFARPEAHVTLDFDKLDAAVAAIASFHADHPLDAVLATDDDGVVLAARVADRLSLAGNSTEGATAARDKRLFRRVLADAGLPGPRRWTFSAGDDARAVADGVAYPCIVKAPALSASRAVIRADDAAGFVSAFERVARILGRSRAPDTGRTPEILVESYLPGDEIALEGLLTEGRLRTLAIFDKPDPLVGPFFEETILVTPSRHPKDTQRAVADAVTAAAAALGLSHGPVHAEARVEGGAPTLLEIAPRTIGGRCSKALRFAGGVSLEEVVLRHAVGAAYEAPERERDASGVMMIPIPRAGILEGVRGQDDAARVPGITEIELTHAIGADLVPLPEGSRYVGFIFARGEAPEEVVASLKKAHGFLQLDIRAAGDGA
ncbi:MAG: ATP-grasp domain-containing protein [Acidobacteriota bacterium]|nr:ATP-grasp domain-containing protein [Acidobacteriota bacterium]